MTTHTTDTVSVVQASMLLEPGLPVELKNCHLRPKLMELHDQRMVPAFSSAHTQRTHEQDNHERNDRNIHGKISFGEILNPFRSKCYGAPTVARAVPNARASTTAPFGKQTGNSVPLQTMDWAEFHENFLDLAKRLTHDDDEVAARTLLKKIWEETAVSTMSDLKTIDSKIRMIHLEDRYRNSSGLLTEVAVNRIFANADDYKWVSFDELLVRLRPHLIKMDVLDRAVGSLYIVHWKYNDIREVLDSALMVVTAVASPESQSVSASFEAMAKVLTGFRKVVSDHARNGRHGDWVESVMRELVDADSESNAHKRIQKYANLPQEDRWARVIKRKGFKDRVDTNARVRDIWSSVKKALNEDNIVKQMQI